VRRTGSAGPEVREDLVEHRRLSASAQIVVLLLAASFFIWRF